MLRARIAVGLALAAVAAAAGALIAAGGDAPGAPPRESCGYSESSYTTDSLHDVRSFADAMAIVRGVKEELPPEPRGPEGWAGLIGRRVTVEVERVLWRRPHAPKPPRSMRYIDLGWGGTVEDRHPIHVERSTRLVLGRRYLAPIVRHHGEWYPFFTVRLRLRGDLVVGGVDCDKPENSHAALQGRRVREAVRMVAETAPYRAVVLNPEGSPAQRWQRVDRDHYRIWGGGRGLPVIIDSGVTKRARWQLYLRLPKRGGMCVGMTARPLWRSSPAPSGEGCGPRELGRRLLLPSVFGSDRHGAFALGRTRGIRLAWVRIRFDGEDWRRLDTLPTPIPPGGRGRFWVVPAPRDCLRFTVQALDRDGNVAAEERVQAACRKG
jgi:hypothetical protein